MSLIRRISLLIPVLVITATVLASESDELRSKAKLLERKADYLAAEGRHDQAEELRILAHELILKAEHVNQHESEPRDSKIAALHKWLDQLHQKQRALAGVEGSEAAAEKIRDAIMKGRRELAELEELRVREHAERREQLAHPPRDHHQERGGHPEGHQDFLQRREHMHQAMEHLHKAGLHEMAEHVAERTEQLEREFHEAHQHEHEDPLHGIQRQLDEMRHELQRLREDVERLQRRH